MPDQPVVDGSVELSCKKKHVTSFATTQGKAIKRQSKTICCRWYSQWPTCSWPSRLARISVLGNTMINKWDLSCKRFYGRPVWLYFRRRYPASSKNPNVSLIFLSYKYLPAYKIYTIAGKCNATKVLLSNVTNSVQEIERGQIITNAWGIWNISWRCRYTIATAPRSYSPIQWTL